VAKGVVGDGVVEGVVVDGVVVEGVVERAARGLVTDVMAQR
jgi:hypothetical protein